MDLGSGEQNRLRKTWEPIYTIAYRVARPTDAPFLEIPWDVPFVEEFLGTEQLPKATVIKYLQRHGAPEWLKIWKLGGKLKAVSKGRNCRQVVAAFKDFVQCNTQGSVGGEAPEDVFSNPSSPLPTLSPSSMPTEEEDEASTASTGAAENILRLIRLLYDLAFNALPLAEKGGHSQEVPRAIELSDTDFISHKLTNKLRQQISDPLVLASNALPNWCEELTTSCPVLFPFEARQLFFSSSAFGVSRTIAWIQHQHETTERARQGGVRRPDDGNEFRIGRLTSERVFVPRSDQLLEWAMNIMRVHAARKSVLDIEFQDEQVCLFCSQVVVLYRVFRLLKPCSTD